MRIVIAEDSAVVRACLVEILADYGHEVAAAVGDAGALRAAVAASWPSSATSRVDGGSSLATEGGVVGAPRLGVVA